MKFREKQGLSIIKIKKIISITVKMEIWE